VVIVMAVLAAVAVGTPGWAQSDDPDVEELLKKLQQLEQQNQGLQAEIDALKAAVSDMQAKPAEVDPEVVKAAVAEAAPVKTGGKEWLTVKGFISATWWAQDQQFAFGNGQNAQWPVGAEHTDNEWFNGGDVRNTRLTLGFNGPTFDNGWAAGGALELDFFGGFNGSGAFSQQQTVPRLRLAYADIKKGGTTIRIGQFWTPLFGEVPASLSHVAFPLGYGSAGMVGWRFPGVFWYQKLTGPDAAIQTQLDVAVFEGSWNGPGDLLANRSAGNVDFNAQVEAKINFSGKNWKLYGAAHWDEKDLNGVNNEGQPVLFPKDSLTGTAFEVGGSFKIGAFLIHGNIYTSKAAGQQFAAITQFGDISDVGGWLQAGFNLGDRWSIYGFYGMADPDNDDVLEWVGANGRMKNEMTAFMLQYSLGQYSLGLEYLTDSVYMGADENKLTGNQFAFSAMYKF